MEEFNNRLLKMCQIRSTLQNEGNRNLIFTKNPSIFTISMKLVLTNKKMVAFRDNFQFIPKTNYDSETVIPLYITDCMEKIYFESAIVAKRRRLIRVICFLTTASDIKRYHRLRTVISLVSGFFLMLCTCQKI